MLSYPDHLLATNFVRWEEFFCQQMILVLSRLTENLGLDLNGPLLKTIVQVSESFGIIWNGFCNICHISLNLQGQIDMWTHNACSQECLKHFSSILIDSLHIQIVSKEAVFSRSLIEFSIWEFEFQFWTDRPSRLLNWRRKKQLDEIAKFRRQNTQNELQVPRTALKRIKRLKLRLETTENMSAMV